MPRDGCVTFPHGDKGVCLQFVIVVFPDHTHYFCGTDSLLGMSVTTVGGSGRQSVTGS